MLPETGGIQLPSRMETHDGDVGRVSLTISATRPPAENIIITSGVFLATEAGQNKVSRLRSGY